MGLPDVIYECHEAVTSYRLIPNPVTALGGGYKYGAALQWKDDGADWQNSFHIAPEAMEALGHALLLAAKDYRK